jgi:hypothetical protein
MDRLAYAMSLSLDFRTWIPFKKKPGAAPKLEKAFDLLEFRFHHRVRWFIVGLILLTGIGLLVFLFTNIFSPDSKTSSLVDSKPVGPLVVEEVRVKVEPPKVNSIPSVPVGKSIHNTSTPSQSFRKPSRHIPTRIVRSKKIHNSVTPIIPIKNNVDLGIIPKMVTPLYEKAKWYHRQERYEEAIPLYLQVVKQDPKHFNAKFNLVSAYVETNDWAKAQAGAIDLHKDYPENQQVRINLAIAFIGVGKAAEAISLLDIPIPANSMFQFEIYFYRGLAFRRLNQPKKAISSYQEAERLRPKDSRLLFNLALIWDSLQEFNKAISYYQKYLLSVKANDSPERQNVQKRVRILLANAGVSQPQSSVTP